MMQTFYTSGYSREDSDLSIPIYKKQPVDEKISNMQAEIDELKDSLAADNDLKTRNAELFNQLYAMHKSFSEDMYIKALRELEDVLEKNKQEKE